MVGAIDVGESVGRIVGLTVVGAMVGCVVVGAAVGLVVGAVVGLRVVGAFVPITGARVGEFVGEAVADVMAREQNLTIFWWRTLPVKSGSKTVSITFNNPLQAGSSTERTSEVSNFKGSTVTNTVSSGASVSTDP